MKKLFLVLSIFAVLGLASCGTPLDNEAQAKDLSKVATTAVKEVVKSAQWDAPKGIAEDVSKLLDGDYSAKLSVDNTKNNSNLTGSATGKIAFSSKKISDTRNIKGSASIAFVDFGVVVDGEKYFLNGSFKVSFVSKVNLKDLKKNETTFKAGTPIAITMKTPSDVYGFYMNFKSEIGFGDLTPKTTLNVNGEKWNFKLDLEMDDFLMD